MTETADSTLATSRMTAGALAGGVAVFLVVAWVITAGGKSPISPGAFSADVALWLWAAVATSGLAGALVFRARAVREVEQGISVDDAEAETAGRVQANLVIAWALLEGQAILGVLLFLMVGQPVLAWMSVAVFAVGMARTFPRAEWFAGRLDA